METKGILRVLTPKATEELRQKEAEAKDAPDLGEEQAISELAAYLRKRFQEFKTHRSGRRIDKRMQEALRAYNGEYAPDVLREIEKFGGSRVFARLTTVKCRGATAMLRDVFLGAQRPWGLQPTPIPDMPEDLTESINTILQSEVQTLESAGQPVPPEVTQRRKQQLVESARRAQYKQAEKAAKRAEKFLDDILLEGGFYSALAEFLIDLPIFPFACIKGPVVQQAMKVDWVDGELVSQMRPQMFWYRVSPFDLFIEPGADQDTAHAAVFERMRMSRAELNALIGLPGYDDEAIRAALDEYGEQGHNEFEDTTDSTRAYLEDREVPQQNTSSLIDTLEWNGPIQGKLLKEFGFTEQQIPDETRDYDVSAWLVGRHVIKVQLNPNPRKRHPYYITSFEKVPGSAYGHGVFEIISDIQSVANATLRSLVNNLSISSGPQVVVTEDRISPSTDPDSMYPWKRWRVMSDIAGNSGQRPIDFFQPQSNAAELLSVYNAMTNIADEVSAIPRYITGSSRVGGAGATASGLAMLQNNASKVLQNVAANIDRDVISPLLRTLYDMVLLTDPTGEVSGDSNIVVRGMEIAMAKEQDRMRRLEFLTLTANPIDMNIVGVEGRASLLRSLADDLGLPGDEIVPDAEKLQMLQEAQQQQQMAEQAAQAQAMQGTPGDGAGRMGEETDNMFRNRTVNVPSVRNLG